MNGRRAPRERATKGIELSRRGKRGQRVRRSAPRPKASPDNANSGRRQLTVGRVYQYRARGGAVALPFIRISGLWVEAMGFRCGDVVDVLVRPGSIRIRLHQPPANAISLGAAKAKCTSVTEP